MKVLLLLIGLFQMFRRWGVLVAASELRALQCRSPDLHGAGGLPILQRRPRPLGA